MDLKDALGQIEADGGDVHNKWLLYRVVAATAPLQGIRMPSTAAGAIHPICFRAEANLASTADMGRKAAIPYARDNCRLARRISRLLPSPNTCHHRSRYLADLRPTSTASFRRGPHELISFLGV